MPEFGHDRGGFSRALALHQLQDFGPYALARQPLEFVARADAGGKCRLVRRAIGIAGEKAEEAEHPQIILGDARRRIADEAHAPRPDVREPADEIDHFAVALEEQRVDRKVAPFRVRFPVAAKTHLGVAAEGLDVLAQRGDLERLAVHDNRNGAVFDAGGNGVEAGLARAAHDLVGHRRGRQIDLADLKTEQRIAHRAADHARFLAVLVEHRQKPHERIVRQPRHFLRGQALGRPAHLIRPGTSRPSSMCAGS